MLLRNPFSLRLRGVRRSPRSLQKTASGRKGSRALTCRADAVV